MVVNEERLKRIKEDVKEYLSGFEELKPSAVETILGQARVEAALHEVLSTYRNLFILATVPSARQSLKELLEVILSESEAV